MLVAIANLLGRVFPLSAYRVDFLVGLILANLLLRAVAVFKTCPASRRLSNR